jgi:hypothetical protein
MKIAAKLRLRFVAMVPILRGDLGQESLEQDPKVTGHHNSACSFYSGY